MASARIPQSIEDDLRDLQVKLEIKYGKAAPSMQDILTVALKRLLADWEIEQAELITELLRQREEARSRMGNRS